MQLAQRSYEIMVSDRKSCLTTRAVQYGQNNQISISDFFNEKCNSDFICDFCNYFFLLFQTSYKQQQNKTFHKLYTHLNCTTV